MPSGTLEVLLVGATGIKDTEIFGKGDPYCILTCGRTQARSNTAEDQGSKPVWNQKFTLGVDESTSEIWIRIYNRNVLEDDELGSCIIPLSRVYNSAHKLPTTSFSVLRPSGRQQGEIKLSMTFVPKGMGGPGYGTGAPIQPNLYGPGTPAPYSVPGSMQYPYPNPNPNPGSNCQPPPPPPPRPSYPPAGPPFGYGDTNPIPYPPPPPTDPYRRPPNQDPYGTNTYATSGPYGMQPGYGGSKKEKDSYGPYGVVPQGPGYGGVGPPSVYPPLGDQYGKAPKHDPYGNPSSQPPMGGYGGPQAPPAAIPPAMGYPAQRPLGLKTNGPPPPPPAGYPKVGGYGAQTGGYIPPANPNDPYGNKFPHGAPGYNVDAAAAGIAALGLAGAAAYGVNEHNKVGKPEKMMGGQSGYGGGGDYGPQGYPAPAAGYGGPGAHGYSQPAPPLGGSAQYTPAGYPAVYGTQGSSRGKYEVHHEGCHKMKKCNKDTKKNKKGKRK